MLHIQMHQDGAPWKSMVAAADAAEKEAGNLAIHVDLLCWDFFLDFSESAPEGAVERSGDGVRAPNFSGPTGGQAHATEHTYLLLHLDNSPAER
ncbi:uncharacterized protein LOC144222077 isoform X2 [Crocuta crocuta]